MVENESALKFAAFSKIWPLPTLRLLPLILRTNIHVSSKSFQAGYLISPPDGKAPLLRRQIPQCGELPQISNVDLEWPDLMILSQDSIQILPNLVTKSLNLVTLRWPRVCRKGVHRWTNCRRRGWTWQHPDPSPETGHRPKWTSYLAKNSVWRGSWNRSKNYLSAEGQWRSKYLHPCTCIETLTVEA